MELETSYQLLGVLRDDGIRTYNAVEIASGQAMQVHLFAKPDTEPDRTLYKALRALPASKRREILDTGMENDMPYIVTDKLPEGTTAREWLTKLAGVTPPVPKHAGPVTLAGSWKTGTPIPEEVIRASHASLPPRQPPPAKPVELGPDYTRVMRLPQTFGEAPSSDAPPTPPPAGPAQTMVLKADAAPVKPEPVAEKAPGPPDEFDLLFRNSRSTPPPPEPAAATAAPPQPGGFTRMFLANQPPEAATPVVPQPPAEPVVAQPVVVPQPLAAEPAAKEPGEFTRMFRAGQPQETAPPVVPQPPAEPVVAQPVVAAHPVTSPPPVAQPAAKEPGEFTRMFLAGQAQQTPTPVVPPKSAEPPLVQPLMAETAAKESGDFTRMFLSSQPQQAGPVQPLQAAAPPPSLEPRQFSAAQAPPVKPSSEESTRIFQAVTPSTPPPQAQEPGEFTRMFPQGRPDSPALPVESTPGHAAPPTPTHSDGPGEFTRFFQSPIYPTPGGNQKVPPTPQLSSQMGPPAGLPGGFAPNPPSSRSTKDAGEFTQMFGNPNRPPDPWGTPAQSQPPPMGSPSSATGAFSIPKAASFPPRSRSSEPGEFTRMMAATAPPTLGQPTGKAGAPLGGQPAAQPAAKSMMPLYIGAGAVLLAIILVILFFVLRHG